MRKNQFHFYPQLALLLFLLLTLNSLCVYAADLDKDETASVISGEWDLSDLAVDDRFCCKGLDWGISMEELEEERNIKLTPISPDAPYYADANEEVLLCGEKGIIQYECNPNLDSVHLRFQTDKETFLDDLQKGLKEKYGECEQRDTRQYGYGKLLYGWGKIDSDLQATSLDLYALYENDKLARVDIFVGKILDDIKPRERFFSYGPSLELTLSGWLKDDQFCYQGIDWGILKEDLESELGIELEPIMPSVPVYLTGNQKVHLYEVNGTVMYELRPDFRSVHFNFKTDEEAFLNRVLDALTSEYGEYEVSSFGQEQRKGYRWFRPDQDDPQTSIQVQTSYDQNTLTDVDIFVGRIINSEEES